MNNVCLGKKTFKLITILISIYLLKMLKLLKTHIFYFIFIQKLLCHPARLYNTWELFLSTTRLSNIKTHLPPGQRLMIWSHKSIFRVRSTLPSNCKLSIEIFVDWSRQGSRPEHTTPGPIGVPSVRPSFNRAVSLSVALS